MIVLVNGQELQLPDGSTGEQLLELVDLPRATLVAEVNGNIVPRQDFLELVLQEGDRLELVTLVGGG